MPQIKLDGFIDTIEATKDTHEIAGKEVRVYELTLKVRLPITELQTISKMANPSGVLSLVGTVPDQKVFAVEQ